MATQTIRDTAESARRYLASPEGRRARHRVASVLAAAAPLLATLPVMRRSRLGRLLGLAGGAALLVKFAGKLRDWEPQERLA